MTSPATDSAQRIRLTISITPEVHAVFQRMSAASGMSMSRAMGEWLEDTSEAALFMASKLEEARAAPRLVARELHSYALGLADQTLQLIESVRAGTSGGGAATAAQQAAGRRVPGGSIPPFSNTGGKGPSKVTNRGGKASPKGGRS